MKSGWQTKRLGDVAEISAGNSAPQDAALFKDGIYPFFRTADAGRVRFGDIYESTDYLNEEGIRRLRQYPKGTILFPKSGASTFLNHRVMLGVEGCVSSHLATIVANDTHIKPRYLLYFLSTIAAQDLIQDHAYPSLNLPTIAGISIEIPPLPEQQRIVGILDEAFEGIATAKANAEKNLQNARALFESHLQAIFTQRGKGWVVIPIGEVAEVFDGPHATPKTVDAGPVFLGISALLDGKINLGETRHVTSEDFQQWTRRVKPQADDVVFSYETRLGQAAIIPSGLECCLGRRMGLVRANRKRLDPRFFVYQYISPQFREFLDSKTVRGATVDRIPLREFPSFTIKLPTLNEQELIADQIELFREETQRLESIYQQKVTALEALKKSLLNQAFTGNL